MNTLSRFGVSLEQGLLKQFDNAISKMGYPNRSKAIADIIRAKLAEKQWQAGKEAIGTICMIYDHSQRELSKNLTHIQHENHENILTSQHIHLDPRNCLEVIIVRGNTKRIQKLANALASSAGVKHVTTAMSPTEEQSRY
jgi:CopG family nickel-responsive transcriptional regulator